MERWCGHPSSVEPPPEKLHALIRTLRDAGHCVFAAYDGAAVLEMVDLLPNIHLLLTNTRLGTVDGPEPMRHTREIHPGRPILHVVHQGCPNGDEPVDVLTLREPPSRRSTSFMAVGTLLA